MIHRIIANLPEPREIFWPTITKCISSNPQSARWIVALTALYLHLGPFSRYVVGQIEQKLEGLETPSLINANSPFDLKSQATTQLYEQVAVSSDLMVLPVVN